MTPDSMSSLIAAKLRQLPPIELSYETYSSHRKSPTLNEQYQVGLLIPKSKKYIAWFTFLGEDDVCILLELNREKQVVSHRIVHAEFDAEAPHLALGTFFYGSLVHENYTVPEAASPRMLFVVEDILIYQSVSLRKLCYGDCLGILHELLCRPGYLHGRAGSDLFPEPADLPRIGFVLPVLFPRGGSVTAAVETAGYPVHHIQYRSLTHQVPYINQPVGVADTDLSAGLGPGLAPTLTPPLPAASSSVRPPPPRGAGPYKEPSGKERAVFRVTAELASDMYVLEHLTGQYVTDVAYIPNYKTSVFMNSLFRNIKENRCLDATEESDDEDDFLDIRADKYVDTTRQLRMECVYHRKFRRWIPLRVVT